MDRFGIAVAGTKIVDIINFIYKFSSEGELTSISMGLKAIGAVFRTLLLTSSILTRI